jgi:predicted dinucleotide-binding enzyme/cytosine/adenosine deaminase-related metal-dependent hydrolase
MVSMRLSFGALIGLVFLCTSAQAQSTTLAIRGAWVVDVTDGSLHPDQTVLIQGNRIAAIGPTTAIAVPQGAEIVDAAGGYLIPGLWDMHTHLLWSTEEGERLWVKMPHELDSWTLWEHYYAPSLDLLIANGLTGIREMWGNPDIARRVQAEAEAGVRLVPRMIMAGHRVDGAPPLWPGALVAATPERGRALVDSLAAAGADFIKPYSHLAPDVYFAIVERARERGIAVAGHVPFRVPASAAVAAGQRSFEHLIGILQGCSSEEARLIDLSREQIEAAGHEDHERVAELDREWKVRVLATQNHDDCRALLATLVRSGTWQVPTLVLNRGLAYLDDPDFAADPRLKYIPPAWRESWLPENDPYLLSTVEGYQLRRQHHARKMEITGLAAQVGVGIMAGSDTPNAFVFPGFGLHDELELLVEAGLTPLQALQAATLNPARYLEATDSLGTVTPGKLADLVLLDANPLEDIRNTRRIRAVVLDGRYLDRQALDGLLADAERAANAPAQARPAVAMIGTGNLGAMLGPVIAGLGYPLIYGSREPERETVRALVARSGANASAALPRDAAGQAEIIILGVPSDVLEEVARGLGDLTGKIVIDVSGGSKRVADDGYLELVSDSTNAERLQSRHPTARVVRIMIPTIVYFVEPLLAGAPPTVPIAGQDPRAREAVARMIFDVGLDPWDAGPLRFSRVFDAMGLMSLVPAQQGHTEAYELRFLPSVPLSCFRDVSELFGFGRPYDLGDVPPFPRRQPPLPCSEWHRRLEGIVQR